MSSYSYFEHGSSGAGPSSSTSTAAVATSTAAARSHSQAHVSPPRWSRLSVPGFHNLLYRLDFEESRGNVYALFVTNMVQFWVEERATAPTVSDA